MITPIVSLLHATRGRPQKAARAKRMWFDRCKYPYLVEHIIATEESDSTVDELREILDAMVAFMGRRVTSDYGGSCPAWEGAYRDSRGEVLVQMSDDMEPPNHWDETIRQLIQSYVQPTVLAVSDGFRKDRLLTTFICNRAYAELEGCFLNPAYKSVWSDGHATYRAYQHMLAGRAQVIEARDVVFFHRHHWHDRSVPWDKTYADQNAAERYEQGARLFNELNPGWQAARMPDGSKLVDWV